MPGSACVTPIDRRPPQPRGAPVHLPGATRSSRTQDSRRRRRRLALGRGPLPPLPLQGRAPGARGRLGHGEDRAGQGLRDARAPGGSGLMGTRAAPPSAREEEEETKASLARPRRAPSPRLTCLASPPEPNLDSSSQPARVTLGPARLASASRPRPCGFLRSLAARPLGSVVFVPGRTEKASPPPSQPRSLGLPICKGQRSRGVESELAVISSLQDA